MTDKNSITIKTNPINTDKDISEIVNKLLKTDTIETDPINIRKYFSERANELLKIDTIKTNPININICSEIVNKFLKNDPPKIDPPKIDFKLEIKKLYNKSGGEILKKEELHESNILKNKINSAITTSENLKQQSNDLSSVNKDFAKTETQQQTNALNEDTNGEFGEEKEVKKDVASLCNYFQNSINTNQNIQESATRNTREQKQGRITKRNNVNTGSSRYSTEETRNNFNQLCDFFQDLIDETTPSNGVGFSN